MIRRALHGIAYIVCCLLALATSASAECALGVVDADDRPSVD